MAELKRPLEGVEVVELATFIAGPCCCRYLADLGAHVIKVEAPGGDALRVGVKRVAGGLDFEPCCGEIVAGNDQRLKRARKVWGKDRDNDVYVTEEGQIAWTRQSYS